MGHERCSGGPSRRGFLRGSASLLAARSMPAVLVDPMGSGELRCAVIGMRQRGRELRRALARVPDARVVAICDVDEEVLAREVAELEADGRSVDTYVDLRRVIDRDDVDAVLIATPNHWHALAAIWALQSGKHVYVEKPVSHSVWEGEQLARAAQRSGPIAQAGTQNRSDAGQRGFLEWKAEHDLGAVRWVHAAWYRVRRSIGRAGGPQPVPAWIDHELFCGPRPPLAVQRLSYHYDWHWKWPFGNGEIGNLGAHLVDDLRTLTGVRYPKRVMCAGARFLWEDDGETPNTTLSVFDYGDFSALLELRNLPLAPGGAVGPTLRGCRAGVLVRYERGWFLGTRARSVVYGEHGEELRAWTGDAGKTHLLNFARAIREGDPALRRAPVEDSVRSAATCHLANIAWRTGREATFDDVRRAVGSFDAAHAAIDAWPAHLAAHGLDPAAAQLRLGGWLELAEGESRITGGPCARAARGLLREEYREPFAVPQIA